MIQTLKAELKLRPTYDELVGMIENQGDENRPPIEKIIDRRATLFRNNQFGSQFDNIDFLGLKKQEEDKVKNDLRRAQLNHHGVMNGVSTAVAGMQTSGTTSGYDTPLEVYEGMEREDEMYPDYIQELDGALRRIRLIQEQRQDIEDAKSDLDDVHHQSLPEGVPIHSIATDEEEMPPLVNIEEGEEGEDFEDDPELIPADDDETTKAPGQARKHKETIDYSTKITKWQDKSVQEDDIRFQLFLRGIQLTPEQEEEIAKLKVKGKGRNQTRKDYLINYIDRLIQTGKWTDQVNDQLLQKRMIEWREMKKGKGKGSGSASSSSALNTAKDIAIGGVKAGVETLAKAGATVIAKSFLPA